MFPEPHTASAPLYKRDVKGGIRIWHAELGHVGEDSAGWRTVSGLLDGQKVTSGWSITTPKNVGKKNATTAFQQADAEITAEIVKRRERGYFISIDQIDNPIHFKPMLAQDWDKRKAKVDTDSLLFSQPKLDGIRCVARADGLWTRTGKPITAVPHIREALAPLFERDPDLIFDGELYNHDLRHDFNTITSIVRKVAPSAEEIETARVIQYHIYDMPSHDGIFGKRHFALYDLLSWNHWASQGIVIVSTRLCWTAEALDEAYGEYMADGYEGQMIRLDNVYENKRSNSLLKRKEFMTAEFPVLAVHRGNGNWNGHVKSATVQVSPEVTSDATFRGSQDDLVYDEFLAQGPLTWATVRFFGYTPDGSLRFPVIIDYGRGARED